MWNLDWQLAKSPWFKRSGGQDHVIVMSHWLHAFRGNEEIPLNLKRCSAIAFEDKNVYRLAFNYSRQCQQQRTCTHTHSIQVRAHTHTHTHTLPSRYVHTHTHTHTSFHSGSEHRVPNVSGFISINVQLNTVIVNNYYMNIIVL